MRSEADRALGLYQKYIVTRTDGSSALGRKHSGCFYFVLDTTHDQYALPALAAYADACEEAFPLLARDLRRLIEAATDRGEESHE